MAKNRVAAKNFTNRLEGQEALAKDLDVMDTGDAEASLTYNVKCSALRKNGYVMIRGLPCKIVEMSSSKTGKHGHAKVHLVGLDIFTGKKYDDICPSTHNMSVPVVERKDYTVIGMSRDGYASLLDDDGHMRQDLKVEDEEVVKSIRDKTLSDNDADVLVTILKAMDQETVINVKESKK